jgi:type I restriction enzyme S subunit
MRDGWVESILGDLVSIKTGKLDVNAETKNGNYPFFTCAREVYRIDTAAFNGEFVIVAGNGDLNVKYYDGKFNAYQRTYLINSSDKNTLSNKFLYLFMQVYIDFLRSESRGTTIQYLKKGQFTEAKLNLPPLAEQKRIVDLISSVDSYIEALQQQVDKARKSRNAVLDELLTKGGDGWVETTLGEVAALNPEQIKDMNLKRKIRYVDLSTVNFETGIDQSIQPINFSEAPGRARRVIRENDVIISTVRPYLRGFALVDANFDGEIASTGFCVVRANPDIISPYLVWAIASSNNFVNYLIEHSTGSNYPAVRAADILEYTFLLPSKDKQKIIADLILEFDEFSKKVIDTLTKTKNLRSALLSDLLSGNHQIPTTYDKLIGAA